MDNCKYKIFVIDDDPGDAEILRRHLEGITEWQVEFQEANDPEMALETLKTYNPDMIFVDYQLGAMTGLETFRLLRQANHLQPVIMLTGLNSTEVAVESLKEGLADYLAKNIISSSSLKRTIENALEKHKLHEIINKQQRELEMRVEQRTEELAEALDHNKLILKAIPSILISLKNNNTIAGWNYAAETAFGISSKNAKKQPFNQCPIQWEWEQINESIENCRNIGHTMQLDNVPFTRSDGTNGILELTINPVVKKNSSPTGILILGVDITERKSLESQLSQSQKLEAIGQLASGIAHEINTPIQYIGDNTQFLKKSLNSIIELLEQYRQLLENSKENNVASELVSQIEQTIDKLKIEYLIEEIPEAIDESLGGINRVAKIVRAMKKFAHPGTDEKTNIDINQSIESTITVAKNEWKYVAEMKTEFDPDLPLIPVLPGEFNQVILNMIVNAAHAISDVVSDNHGKGEITIRTSIEDKWAKICISDSGSGIPKEVRAKIFDPFFTTKEVGRGTGQGLAIAHDVIVKKHNGIIDCQTEEGKGTTFIIRVPYTPITAEQEKELINV